MPPRPPHHLLRPPRGLAPAILYCVAEVADGDDAAFRRRRAGAGFTADECYREINLRALRAARPSTSSSPQHVPVWYGSQPLFVPPVPHAAADLRRDERRLERAAFNVYEQMVFASSPPSRAAVGQVIGTFVSVITPPDHSVVPGV